MIVSALFTSIGPSSYSASASEREPAARVLCRFEDGKDLANIHSTDYFFFLFRSKSAVTSTQGVNSSWMNKLLTVAGFDFNTPNEAILGRPIRPTSVPEESTKEANEGAPKVSAFDRFGVAGLKWSSYQGEWKYNHVDACAQQNQVSPTNYGTFYDGRVEPKSTHNEVNTSKDPRTIQFDKGVISLITSAAKDTIANGLFGIAKFVVTLTIVFVSLAFTDITALMGLGVDGAAGTTAAGIFTDLFNTVFTGFVLFAFLATAMYLLYNGLVKRQFRMAITTLIKTIFIFMVAIIMSTNPTFWVGMPNQVATYGQAIVLSTMAGMYENGDTDYPTLCSTEVASINEGVDINLGLDKKEMLSEFEKVNINMKSLIGCQMWEQLLFKPWVRGQFGAEYDELASDKLGNINGEWVGKGSVPIGNGKTIDNWALFHLSTQTDAHAQVGDDNFPSFVTGVNADWWRTADALSNYDEEQTTDSIGDGAHSETFMAQVDSDPTKFWQSWVGNNATERMGTAIIAILFAIAGSLAPLVFSLSSAVLGLGVTLLMMTSPIFLLLGTWGGKGDGIFMGWLSALVNTVIKRVGVSILLILSIAISMNIMDLAYKIGIIKAFILMVIVTMLLIKNKKKILGIMASVDFGGAFDPRTKANQFMDKQNNRAKNVGKVSLATAGGAVAGVKTGQGAARGARVGAQSQLRNTMYQSQMGMNVIRQLDITLDDERSEGHNCMMCMVLIGEEEEEIAYRDDEGNYYCIDCADELGVDELHEVVAGRSKSEENPPVSAGETRTKNATKNRSYLSHSKAREMMKSRVVDGKYYWDDKGVQKMAKDNLRKFREDTIVYNNYKFKLGKTARPPAPPEPLQGYIDIALINKAWTDGRIDVVENTYKEAWKTWYEDNAIHAEGITQEHIDKFKKEIDEFAPDISHNEASEILAKDALKEDKKELFKDRDLYIYKNGKLVFNIYEEKKHNQDKDD